MGYTCAVYNNPFQCYTEYWDYCADAVIDLASIITISATITLLFDYITFCSLACRAVQDKCSKLKSALKEYTSWQTLPPHEALSRVKTVRSSLQQASKTTLNFDTRSKLSNITFEMPNFNILSSLEHLGRLKVESSIAAASTLPNGSTDHKSLVGDEPPAKRKKEV